MSSSLVRPFCIAPLCTVCVKLNCFVHLHPVAFDRRCMAVKGLRAANLQGCRAICTNETFMFAYLR